MAHLIAEFLRSIFYTLPMTFCTTEATMEPVREGRNRLLNGWQLSKLYTFEVAARHQSFAMAAEELSLTPGAISHRINQLEEELGIQLFVRSHRKVELTHEGKR